MIATGAVNALMATTSQGVTARPSVHSRRSAAAPTEPLRQLAPTRWSCAGMPGLESHTAPPTLGKIGVGPLPTCVDFEHTHMPTSGCEVDLGRPLWAYSVLDLAALHCGSACAGSGHPMGYASGGRTAATEAPPVPDGSVCLQSCLLAAPLFRQPSAAVAHTPLQRRPGDAAWE